jgi:hypothetical protein
VAEPSASAPAPAPPTAPPPMPAALRTLPFRPSVGVTGSATASIRRWWRSSSR